MMRRVALWLIALLLVALAAGYAILRPPPPLAVPPQGASLDAVILLLPGEEPPGPASLEVNGGQISAIGPARVSTDPLYALPGLADAHMHGPSVPLPGHRELFALLNLYHGVTTVRMAAGDNRMRDDIAVGRYPGPQALTCGPFLDGPGSAWPSAQIVTGVEDAAAAVSQLVGGGYDCAKVYKELAPEASAAIYRRASAAGLPVIGHVPWRQTFAEAHIDDIQHLVGWATPQPDDGDQPQVKRLLNLDQLDAARTNHLVQAALARNFQLTPTLVTLQRKFALADTGALAESASPGLLPGLYQRQLWDNRRGLVSSRLMSEADFARFRQAFPHALAAVRAMHQAGVEILSGTDAPAEYIVPGAGLLEELSLLRAAGLSNEEVLAIASVTTPRRLLNDDAAPWTVGARASFVLYAQDPRQDLAHLANPVGVVVDGRHYSREVLQGQLERYQAWFEHPLYRGLTEGVLGIGLWLLNLLA